MSRIFRVAHSGRTCGAVSDTDRGRGEEAACGRDSDLHGDSPAADLVSRLQAHTRSLRRDVQALKKALAEVDAAVTRSRDRVEQLRRIVPERKVAAKADTDEGQERMVQRRCGGDRRTSSDRRRLEDPISAVVRWLDGLPMDRRSGNERRITPDRRTEGETAAPPAPRAPALPDPSNVVSLAVFRAQRRRNRPPAL